jgi:predicted nucleic acid-binding protein/transposase-like protein
MTDAHEPAAPGTSLRDLNPGRYWPTETEFHDLWSQALVVPDTNVLLDLHRYSVATRDILLAILDSFRDRLWIPHQVAVEYERNRLDVIDQQWRAYDELIRSAEAARKAVATYQKSLRQHLILSFDDVLDIAHSYEKNMRDYVEAQRDKHPQGRPAPGVWMRDDTRERLSAIVAGRVGLPPPTDRLPHLYSEADDRYDRKVPPGYRDADKAAPQRYGDFLLWQEAVDRADAEGRPLIIVTGDEKLDWWWERSGMTVGPHPQLVAEFYRRTGRWYFQYGVPRFIEFASAFLEREVSEAAVSEVQRISEAAADEQVDLRCPNCGHVNEVQLGIAAGSSAIPVCLQCGERFHAHRGSDGDAFVSPVVVRVFKCPSDGTSFRESRPADTAAGTALKKCFACNGELILDWQTGDATRLGDAYVVRGRRQSGKTMRCSRSDDLVTIKAWYDNVPCGVCETCDAIVRGDAASGAT